jgi:hypothetical protein
MDEKIEEMTKAEEVIVKPEKVKADPKDKIIKDLEDQILKLERELSTAIHKEINLRTGIAELLR